VFEEPQHPAFVVWELTLRCDHACRHCGSRAGAPRRDELSTSEALDVVRQLAEMGAREVVLIGGEAYLHEGFLELIAALRGAGIAPTMVTGGLGITAGLARDLARAGIELVSVSIDGLEAAHDQLRAPGSFAAATAALAHLRAAGITTGCNTSLHRLDRTDLEGLYEHLLAAGVRAWQLQLTAPMGRAADRPDLLLQPWDLLELMPRVAALKRRGFADGLLVSPGNNLGYFGPEEALLRSPTLGGRDHFCGCLAGRFILGIEADGGVKGCLSLQSRAYVAGNVRQTSLAELWRSAPRLGLTRERGVESLWGFCRTCAFAATCLGGCGFTSHALFGKQGNNPYCHFRALSFAKQGQRERLVAGAAASGEPMDHGLFELVVEALDAPDPAGDRPPAELVRLGRRADSPADPSACR
jgi:radical SAM protein with 4Fe4S-binding SPASM domain